MSLEIHRLIHSYCGQIAAVRGLEVWRDGVMRMVLVSGAAYR